MTDVKVLNNNSDTELNGNEKSFSSGGVKQVRIVPGQGVIHGSDTEEGVAKFYSANGSLWVLTIDNTGNVVVNPD